MTFGGHLIFFTNDSHGEIRVLDDGKKRVLSFGPGDEQSGCLKSSPAQLIFDYTQVMFLVILFKTPKKVLHLGLGAGSLLTTLQKHVKGIKITAVEMRQSVIDIARDYFFLPQSKRIQVHCGEAGEFIQSYPDRYDLIFSDLYSNTGVSATQLQSTFLNNCAQQLKSEGWLVINYWREHQHDVELLHELKSLFKEIRVCPSKDGNWIIFASKTPCSIDQNQLKANALKWSKILGFSLLKHLKNMSFLT